MSERDHETLMVLIRFHSAWIEAEVAGATGDPDLAREKRLALIAAHKSASDMLYDQHPREERK